MKRFVLSFILLIVAITTYAQAPAGMNYQGRLVDGDTLLTGSHTIEFRIYNTNTIGEIMYAETDTITVDDGFYATELGDNPVPKGSLGGDEPYFENLVDVFGEAEKFGQYWLELEVDGVTLFPREKILSTSYAMVAQEALGVAYGSITSANIANGTITSSDIANGTITRYDMATGMRSTLDSADGSVREAVVVDDDGNVGVGTDVPVAGLQVSAGVDLISPVLRSVLMDSGGTFTNLNGAGSIAVQGNYAYVAAAEDDAISVINISNPDSPSLVTTLKDGVGGFNYLNSVQSLVIDGNYLYAGSEFDDAVSIIDISTPASPVLVSVLVDGIAGYNDLNYVNKLCVHNGLLFIPSLQDNAVTIVDISNPATPSIESVLKNGVGGFNNLGGVHAVACEGDYAYIVSEYSDSLTIVDISDPANPVLVSELKDGVGGFDDLNVPYGVAVSGGYVYVGSYSDDALSVIDCRTPASPVLLNVFHDGDGGFNLDATIYAKVVGTYLYIVSRMGAVTVADISDPEIPWALVSIADEQDGFDALYGAYQVAPVGDRLYICADLDDAVTIVDVAAGTTDGKVGLYVADRVGINTPIPREALDVHGNVIASGDITAEDDIISGDDVIAGDDLFATDDVYIESLEGDSGRNVRIASDGRLYASSSKSGYVSVTSCAFHPYNDDSGVYDAYNGTRARMSGGTQPMLAPVQLPHGAEVQNVRLYYDDSDASVNLTMHLYFKSLGNVALNTMASVTSSGSPGYSYVTDTTISYATVDNSIRSYLLYISPTGGNWSSDLALTGARIYYTISD